MLACARIGAVHSVVFGGFAPHELAVRIDDARPKVVVTASLRHRADPGRRVQAAARPGARARRAPRRPRSSSSSGRRPSAELVEGRDVDWDVAMRAGRTDPAECVEVGGHRPALRALHLRHHRQAQGHRARQRRPRGRDGLVAAATSTTSHEGQVWWAASDVGLGRRPLLHRLRAADHRRHDRALRGQAGRHPGRRRVLAGGRRARRQGAVHRARPRSGRSRRRTPTAGCWPSHDLSSLAHPLPRRRAARPRDLRAGPREQLGVPVVDNWWQTETGWPIAANLRGLEPMPIKAGSPSVPVPGLRRRRCSTSGPAGARRHRGRDLPPAAAAAGDAADAVGRRRALRRRRTSRAYDGYYLSGDGGYLDEDGYLFVMGRTDDVINVAGHRLSTGSMEAVLAAHPAVAECAVIGVADDAEGPGAARVRGAQGRRRRRPRARSARELVAAVRDEIGAVAAFKDVAVVGGAAQDPLRQDPAQDDARDRRRQGRPGAVHHRGRGRAGHPAAGAEARLTAARLCG